MELYKALENYIHTADERYLDNWVKNNSSHYSIGKINGINDLFEIIQLYKKYKDSKQELKDLAYALAYLHLKDSLDNILWGINNQALIESNLKKILVLGKDTILDFMKFAVAGHNATRGQLNKFVSYYKIKEEYSNVMDFISGLNSMLIKLDKYRGQETINDMNIIFTLKKCYTTIASCDEKTAKKIANKLSKPLDILMFGTLVLVHYRMNYDNFLDNYQFILNNIFNRTRNQKKMTLAIKKKMSEKSFITYVRFLNQFVFQSGAFKCDKIELQANSELEASLLYMLKILFNMYNTNNKLVFTIKPAESVNFDELKLYIKIIDMELYHDIKSYLRPDGKSVTAFGGELVATVANKYKTIKSGWAEANRYNAIDYILPLYEYLIKKGV